MASNTNPHPQTLLHLVPKNPAAHDALLHPDNLRFVSSYHGRRPGLEVGFHVSSKPQGYVITRLGRNADLILRQTTNENPMSGTHVAFEINPCTHHMLLTTRSKYLLSVTFEIDDEKTEYKETITGGGVILYGQNYEITIASYKFRLIWRTLSAAHETNADLLQGLAMQGYHSSLQLVKGMRSRDRPTDIDLSEAQSWHMTRLATATIPLFQDVVRVREETGSGGFGKVYRAIDRSSGYLFAVKVVDLAANKTLNIETARALLHREIKVMERVKHDHIIEYLGSQHFHTESPEIFMPLRDGALTSLVKSIATSFVPGQPCPDFSARSEESPDMNLHSALFRLSNDVLEHMLRALDYLAHENLIHRDVKPDNILYSKSNAGFTFQLADFGLARHYSRHHSSAGGTVCGTTGFQAPELFPLCSNVNAKQSPKLDIWSLFATIAAVRSAFRDFPPGTDQYPVILDALKKKASMSGNLKPMARLHPDCRASAAQMLSTLYEGRGLTTPTAKIPPIGPDVEPQPSLLQAAGPSNSRQAMDGGGRAASRTPPPPLIVYPPPKRYRRMGRHVPKRKAQPTTLQSQPNRAAKAGPNRAAKAGPNRAAKAGPNRAAKAGVVKRRAEPPATRARAVAKPGSEPRPPPESSLPAHEDPPETVLHIPGAFVD